jgi:DNA-binding SARP family transcriptional activator/TolB-like protein
MPTAIVAVRSGHKIERTEVLHVVPLHGVINVLIQLRLFGAVSISDDQGRDLRLSLGQSKRTAMLAYLAIARPRASHRRETLLALFWPELAEDRARRALNQAVYYLRTALGPDSIFVRSDEIGISRDHVDCDVLEYESLLETGDLEQALSLYHGPLLSGFYLTDLLEFERWLETERARLHERAAHAALVLADREAEVGNAHEAIEWARRSMELSHDEAAVRQLMSMRDRFGDRAGAIREYDRFARQLARELEADPSPETQDLIAQIRARSGSITPMAPRPALPTLDLVDRNGDDHPRSQRGGQRDLEWRRALAPTPRRSWKPHVLALISVPVLLLVAWVASRAMLSPKSTAAVAETVAVLPFSYTGSIDHADAAEAVVNLLDANIENASGMRTVDWRSVKSFVNRSAGGSLTLASASAAAMRFHADMYIVGSVTEAGDRLRVTAAIYDRANGDTLGTRAIAEGDPERLFGIVDELTAKLLSSRNSGPSARLYRSAILTTSSITALKAYLDGERDFREARYISAQQRFRTAVEADSAFALAYFRLSQSAELTGETTLAAWAAGEALEHGRGLGRYEKQHAEAWRLTLQGQARRAMGIYQDLINEDTTDIEALQQLAYLQYYWGPRYGHPASESGRAWRRVLNLDPYNPLALVHLARIMAQNGNREEFRWLADRMSRFGPETDRGLELRALSAFVFGDSASQRGVARDLSTVTPNVRRRVLTSIFTSWTDLGSASSLASNNARTKNKGDGELGDADDDWLQASVSVARGNIRQALAAVRHDGPMAALYTGAIMFVYSTAVPREEMQTLRDELTSTAGSHTDVPLRAASHYVAGLLDLRLGDTAAVAREIAQLGTARTSTGAPRSSRLLNAELFRSRGDRRRALAALGTPVVEGSRIPTGFAFPLAHERFLRGELLRELQRPGEALRWYSTFPDPAGYDLIYLASATSRIAETYEKLGNRAAAEKFNRRLALLWRDADPALKSRNR